MDTHTHTHIHTHSHTHTYTHIHTHSHTHMQDGLQAEPSWGSSSSSTQQGRFAHSVPFTHAATSGEHAGVAVNAMQSALVLL